MTAEFVSSSDRVVVTSTQRATILRRRRFVFAFLVGLTLAGLVAWLGSILANDGFDILDLLMIISFLIYAPWIVIGFWNSLIGLILLRSTVDPVRQVMPEAVDARDSGPMTVRSAVVMTIRNEEPARVFAHLELLIESLGKTGHGHAFDYFLLSDSSLPQVIGAEEQAFEVWYQKLPPDCRLVYRRRESNVGFKGGNDTDSLMSGETVVRFVRIMQSNPRIGILQSLAVGLPSTSLFARIFQFGHRLGMRVFVLGAGWWQGDRPSSASPRSLSTAGYLCFPAAPSAATSSATIKSRQCSCIAPVMRCASCRRNAEAMKAILRRCPTTSSATADGVRATFRICGSLD
jgi:membrane glycosyltransferase